MQVLDQFHQREEANKKLRDELDSLQLKFGSAKHQVIVDALNNI